VLFLGLGYAYAARLAGSWSDIHGAKTAFVFAGAAVGVGLVSAAIIGARQGTGPWLLVPGVVLVAGIIVTRPQIAPAVGSAGKITTGFEAALFALLSVVWCVSSIAFLGLLPRMWRARKAFSRTKHGLHITRAPHWSAAPSTPIPLVEWRKFAESRDDLAAFDPLAQDQSLASPGGPARDGKAARRMAATERQLQASQDLILTRPDLIARNPDLARALPPGMPIYTFTYARDDGSRMYLTWFNGEIVIAGVGRDRAGDVERMQPIAWSLGAHLEDDKGKVYEHV
jgi:MFS family permease